jgi:hypothetical protein
MPKYNNDELQSGQLCNIANELAVINERVEIFTSFMMRDIKTENKVMDIIKEYPRGITLNKLSRLSQITYPKLKSILYSLQLRTEITQTENGFKSL